jgi:hypothetical protein
MVKKVCAGTSGFEGLLKFIHACNLLVGFPYFVNAKSFWACFELAFKDPKYAAVMPSHTDLL